MNYEVLFKLAPPAIFGLPQGDRAVLPVTGQEVQIEGPVMDTRSGVLVSHGTLSEYRKPGEAVRAQRELVGMRVAITDNFLRVSLDADTPDAAHDAATRFADLVCQVLSAQYGTRFSADYLSTQDGTGTPHRVRRLKQMQLISATTYNLSELRGRLNTAFQWATEVDERARKALLYFEHACLLSEFAQTLRFSSPHAAFSWALAFLQLYKALVVILGEPGTDRDYQSRARNLGLSADFWTARVKELYDVRNDEDVAHYALAVPEPGAMIGRFHQAAAVFREVLEAYMNHLSR